MCVNECVDFLSTTLFTVEAVLISPILYLLIFPSCNHWGIVNSWLYVNIILYTSEDERIKKYKTGDWSNGYGGDEEDDHNDKSKETFIFLDSYYLTRADHSLNKWAKDYF